MSTKFTPGPYIFEPHSMFGHEIDGEIFPFGYISTSAPQPIFALEPILVFPIEEMAATARLFAAAPDLYRAAEYFEWCADVNGDGTASHCAVCDAHQMNGHAADCWLGSALAKARGETP